MKPPKQLVFVGPFFDPYAIQPRSKVAPEISINQDLRQTSKKSWKQMAAVILVFALVLAVSAFFLVRIVQRSTNYQDKVDKYGDPLENGDQVCPHSYLRDNGKCDQAIVTNALCDYDKPDCNDLQVCYWIDSKTFFDCDHPFHATNPGCNYVCLE